MVNASAFQRLQAERPKGKENACRSHQDWPTRWLDFVTAVFPKTGKLVQHSDPSPATGSFAADALNGQNQAELMISRGWPHFASKFHRVCKVSPSTTTLELSTTRWSMLLLDVRYPTSDWFSNGKLWIAYDYVKTLHSKATVQVQYCMDNVSLVKACKGHVEQLKHDHI